MKRIKVEKDILTGRTVLKIVDESVYPLTVYDPKAGEYRIIKTKKGGLILNK